MYFLLYRSIGNSEKDLQNCSREQWTFPANYACETVVEIRANKDSCNKVFMYLSFRKEKERKENP